MVATARRARGCDFFGFFRGSGLGKFRVGRKKKRARKPRQGLSSAFSPHFESHSPWASAWARCRGQRRSRRCGHRRRFGRRKWSRLRQCPLSLQYRRFRRRLRRSLRATERRRKGRRAAPSRPASKAASKAASRRSAEGGRSARAERGGSARAEEESASYDKESKREFVMRQSPRSPVAHSLAKADNQNLARLLFSRFSIAKGIVKAATSPFFVHVVLFVEGCSPTFLASSPHPRPPPTHTHTHKFSLACSSLGFLQRCFQIVLLCAQREKKGGGLCGKETKDKRQKKTKENF